MKKTEATGRYDCIRLENQLCFPLYACAKEIVRRYREPLGALNLTYTQYIAMMALWEHDSLTEGELGEKIYLDSGTLTPVLKRLENLGYLTRTRSETDERRLRLTLTEQGRALREQAVEVPAAMQGCIDLPTEELLQLKALLDRALERMSETRDRAKPQKEEKTA